MIYPSEINYKEALQTEFKFFGLYILESLLTYMGVKNNGEDSSRKKEGTETFIFDSS